MCFWCDVIGVKPNPSGLPSTLLFGTPGPFTFELTQFSSRLTCYIFYFVIIIKGSPKLSGCPCIQCYGWQQCHTLFDQTASDRWRTHTETEGRCFSPSDSFSDNIHSASCKLKENYETERQTRNKQTKKIFVHFWGSQASLGIHEYMLLVLAQHTASIVDRLQLSRSVV